MTFGIKIYLKNKKKTEIKHTQRLRNNKRRHHNRIKWKKIFEQQ